MYTQDIDAGVSIRQALAKEQLFVKEHPGYRALQHRVGTGTLAKLLNQVSINTHITYSTVRCCYYQKRL
jgi:Dynamin central region